MREPRQAARKKSIRKGGPPGVNPRGPVLCQACKKREARGKNAGGRRAGRAGRPLYGRRYTPPRAAIHRK